MAAPTGGGALERFTIGCSRAGPRSAGKTMAGTKRPGRRWGAPRLEGGHPGRHAGWKPALLKEERDALRGIGICASPARHHPRNRRLRWPIAAFVLWSIELVGSREIRNNRSIMRKNRRRGRGGESTAQGTESSGPHKAAGAAERATRAVSRSARISKPGPHSTQPEDSACWTGYAPDDSDSGCVLSDWIWPASHYPRTA